MKLFLLLTIFMLVIGDPESPSGDPTDPEEGDPESPQVVMVA